MITRHRVIMTIDNLRTDEREEDVWFIVPEEDPESDLMHDFQMDWDVWVRMHKPHTITLTVEVGDTLNEEPAVEGLGGEKIAD